jgi:hypothetical protein
MQQTRLTVWMLAGWLLVRTVQAGGLSGMVWDGTGPYPDEAFTGLEKALQEAKAAGEGSYGPRVEKAMDDLLNPGGPLKGARVVVRAVDGATMGQARKTVTDERGCFKLNQVEAGRYAMTIIKPGRQGEEAAEATWQVEVPSKDVYYDRATRLDVFFPSELVTARGRVTDDRGRPLAGVSVRAESYGYDGEMNRWPAETHVVTAVTDAKGRYELPDLHECHLWHVLRRGADYSLLVSAKGYASVLEPLKVVTPATLRSAQRMVSLFQAMDGSDAESWGGPLPWPKPADARTRTLQIPDIRLSREATLGGRVVDASGSVLTNAFIVLRPGEDVPNFRPPREEGFTPIESRADSGGRFLFQGLPPGHYYVSVSVSGRSLQFPEDPVALPSGGAVTNLECRYEVPSTGFIEATVRDAVTGQPVTNYFAYVTNVEAQPPVAWSSGGLIVQPEAQQHFRVAGISPGRAVIRIEGAGYVMQKVACDVVAGQTTELPIALVPGGTACIRVIRNGNLIKPYHILAWPDGAREPFHWSRHLDVDGAAVFSNLPPGLNRLRAVDLAPDPNRNILGEVMIEAGKTNEVLLVDAEEAALEIRATFVPTTQVRVWIEPVSAPVEEDWDACYALLSYKTITRSGSPVKFMLPAGEYRVSAQFMPGTASAEHTPLKADQTRVIRLDANRTEGISFAY